MAGESTKAKTKDSTKETSSSTDGSPFGSILERIGESEAIIKDQREPGGLRRIRLRPLSAAMESAAHAAFPAATPPIGEDGTPDTEDAEYRAETRRVQLAVGVSLACALVGEPVRVDRERVIVYGERLPGADLHTSMVEYMRLAFEQHAETFSKEDLDAILDASFEASSPSGMVRSAGNSSAPPTTTSPPPASTPGGTDDPSAGDGSSPTTPSGPTAPASSAS